MARQFDGIGDYIDCTNALVFNPSGVDNGPFALCGWVSVPTLVPGTQGTLFGKGFDGKTAYAWGLDQSVNGIDFASFDGSLSHGVITGAAGTPPLGSITYAALGWAINSYHHVYGDHTGTTWRIVFDGDVANMLTTVDHGAYANTARFMMGAVATGTFSQAQFGACTLADIALFNGPMTNTEIVNLGHGAQRPSSGMTQSLLGYWPLTGSSLLDFSGNNNHGTANGTTVVADPPYSGTPITQSHRTIMGMGV